MSDPLRLAIVVMRYGKEVSGGAEQHARWLAEHLTPYAEVHALTTCSITESWEDYYPASTSIIDDVHVHRFAVDEARNFAHLEKYDHVFHQENPTVADESAWLQAQGPTSSQLIRYVKEQQHFFDAFLFYTFEYATTYFCLPAVASKSILLPLAHDHYFTHSHLFKHLLHLPTAIAYMTHASRQLVEHFMVNEHIPNDIIGIGINVPDDIKAERFRTKYKIDGEFLLYVGRIHAGKNVAELLDFYQQYAESNNIPLVLIGREMLPVPDTPNIIRLGHVTEQDKFDALAAASVFILPSLYESLSMVILEAWNTGTAVLVNGRCNVTRDQVIRANGGLYYNTYHEFAAALNLLLAHSELRETLGSQGQQFTAENYNWNVVTYKILKLIHLVVSSSN